LPKTQPVLDDKANYEKAWRRKTTAHRRKKLLGCVEFFAYGDSFNETNVEREKTSTKESRQ